MVTIDYFTIVFDKPVHMDAFIIIFISIDHKKTTFVNKIKIKYIIIVKLRNLFLFFLKLILAFITVIKPVSDDS